MPVFNAALPGGGGIDPESYKVQINVDQMYPVLDSVMFNGQTITDSQNLSGSLTVENQSLYWTPLSNPITGGVQLNCTSSGVTVVIDIGFQKPSNTFVVRIRNM